MTSLFDSFRSLVDTLGVVDRVEIQTRYREDADAVTWRAVHIQVHGDHESNGIGFDIDHLTEEKLAEGLQRLVRRVEKSAAETRAAGGGS